MAVLRHLWLRETLLKREKAYEYFQDRVLDKLEAYNFIYNSGSGVF